MVGGYFNFWYICLALDERLLRNLFCFGGRARPKDDVIAVDVRLSDKRSQFCSPEQNRRSQYHQSKFWYAD